MPRALCASARPYRVGVGAPTRSADISPSQRPFLAHTRTSYENATVHRHLRTKGRPPMRSHFIISGFITLFVSMGVAHGDQRSKEISFERPVFVQKGSATWYGGRHVGHKTASGEYFNARALTAAHRTLPFGTIVRVTDIKSGRAITVRINDRGPYGSRAVLDLSESAANFLEMKRRGVCSVRIEAFASDQRGS
jgi:peptidoglycan lytic transglycosylase